MSEKEDQINQDQVRGGKDLKRSATPMGLASEAVLGTAILIALGVWAGKWLDNKFATDPLFTVALPVLGVVLGLARMVKMAFDSDDPEKT